MEHLVYKVYSQEIEDNKYGEKLLCDQFETEDRAISFAEVSCLGNVEGYENYIIIRNSPKHYEYRIGSSRSSGTAYVIIEHILTKQERLENAAYRVRRELEMGEDEQDWMGVLDNNETVSDWAISRLKTICEIIEE